MEGVKFMQSDNHFDKLHKLAVFLIFGMLLKTYKETVQCEKNLTRKCYGEVYTL